MFRMFLAVLFALVVNDRLTGQFAYLSPVPGSGYHHPETGILLRSENVVSQERADGSMFNISGSASGNHDFCATLLSDKKTISLRVHNKFLPGESVTVTVKPQFFLPGDCCTSGFVFSFGISGKKAESLPVDDFLKYDIPPSFPVINIVDSAGSAPGKIFFYNVSPSVTANNRFMTIMDSTGYPVFHRQDNFSGANFKLQQSGYISYFVKDGPDCYHLLLDSCYITIDTFRCVNGYSADFHEFLMLENGHSFLLAEDAQVVDMSLLVAGGNANAVVVGNVVQEFDENKQLVFQWRTWDYFDILDAVNLDFTASVFDVTHINSIDLTTDSNIIISVRVFDEITKINRNTGDIIWRLGGLNNEFTFLNDTAGFNRQHDARWHSGNTLTLFDNGVFHVPVESSAKEYAIDEGAKTAELIWQYSHPNHIYGPKLGNVQRLDNGNTLINWGGNMEAGDPALTEVLPDCTIVFELYFENNYHVLYRGFKFPWNNPCDTIMKLPPQIMNDAVMAKLVFYPNPAQDMVFMRPEDLSVSIESYAVYDIFGRMAACEKNPGKGVDGAYPLTTAGFSDGMYIVSCRSEGKVYQGRFCISR